MRMGMAMGMGMTMLVQAEPWEWEWGGGPVCEEVRGKFSEPLCVSVCDDMDDLVAHPLADSRDPINLKLLHRYEMKILHSTDSSWNYKSLQFGIVE